MPSSRRLASLAVRTVEPSHTLANAPHVTLFPNYCQADPRLAVGLLARTAHDPALGFIQYLQSRGRPRRVSGAHQVDLLCGFASRVQPHYTFMPFQPTESDYSPEKTAADAPHPERGETQQQAKNAVYTGSFDPITLGHLDVIQRAARIFPCVIVGVGINPDKNPLFTLDERVDLVRASVAHLPGVRVEHFDGLAVSFVRRHAARVLLRGMRSLTDIEAEFTMSLANRKLDPDVETVFLMADAQYSHISSSLLKQITPLADDAALSQFVPRPVVAALRRKLQQPAAHGPR